MKTLTTPERVTIEVPIDSSMGISSLITSNPDIIEKIMLRGSYRKSVYATYQAETIVRGSNYIIGYIGGEEVFSMSEIIDFQGYYLAEGERWDIPPIPQEEINKIQGRSITENELILRESVAMTVSYPSGARYEELHLKYGQQWIDDGQLKRYQELGDITEEQYLKIVNSY